MKNLKKFNEDLNETEVYEAGEEIAGSLDAVVLIMDTGTGHSLSNRIPWIKFIATNNKCEIVCIFENNVVIAPEDPYDKNTIKKFKKELGL